MAGCENTTGAGEPATGEDEIWFVRICLKLVLLVWLFKIEDESKYIEAVDEIAELKVLRIGEPTDDSVILGERT